MRKPKPRDRSFQPSGAGKGSADRTTDDVAYRKNFAAINWRKPTPDYIGIIARVMIDSPELQKYRP